MLIKNSFDFCLAIMRVLSERLCYPLARYFHDRISFPRYMNWLVHRPGLERPLPQPIEARFGDLHIFWLKIATGETAPLKEGRDGRGTRTKIRVNDQAARRAQSLNETLREGYGKLTGVFRFLRMAGFDVRNVPNITGVLS